MPPAKREKHFAGFDYARAKAVDCHNVNHAPDSSIIIYLLQSLTQGNTQIDVNCAVTLKPVVDIPLEDHLKVR